MTILTQIELNRIIDKYEIHDLVYRNFSKIIGDSCRVYSIPKFRHQIKVIKKIESYFINKISNRYWGYLIKIQDNELKPHRKQYIDKMLIFVS